MSDVYCTCMQVLRLFRINVFFVNIENWRRHPNIHFRLRKLPMTKHLHFLFTFAGGNCVILILSDVNCTCMRVLCLFRINIFFVGFQNWRRYPKIHDKGRWNDRVICHCDVTYFSGHCYRYDVIVENDVTAQTHCDKRA